MRPIGVPSNAGSTTFILTSPLAYLGVFKLVM
jgi:hypothetical protein